MNETQLPTVAQISSNAMLNLGRDEFNPLETLKKICELLNCSLDYIIELSIEE